MCFGSQEGSLSCFNQPRGQFSVFYQPRGYFPGRHFIACFSTIGPPLVHITVPHCVTSLEMTEVKEVNSCKQTWSTERWFLCTALLSKPSKNNLLVPRNF